MRVELLGVALVLGGCCSAAAGSPPPVTGVGAGAPISNAPVAGGADGAWEGRWCGDVDQAGFPPYPIVMVVTSSRAAGAVCGTTEYTSLGCAANLTCLGWDAGTATFRENLTLGRDRCVEGGTIAARIAGATMLWEYRRPDGVLDATASLTRCSQ